MPYLQLDVTHTYSVQDKKRLAKKLSQTYAKIMQVDIRRISVAIRELGEGGLWRTVNGELKTAAMLMCDIRRGRTAELWLEVAKALCRDCRDVLI